MEKGKHTNKAYDAVLKSKEILKEVTDFLEDHDYGELVFRIAGGDVLMVERRTQKKWGAVPRKYREYYKQND